MQPLEGGISMILDAGYFRRNFIQDGSRDLQDFVATAMVPEAMLPISDPLPMKDFHALGLPTSYIICEDDLAVGDPKL